MLNPANDTDNALPQVSIAVCTYNSAVFLRQQINSLLTQTYRNIEVIVVDDASADHTTAILAEYAQQDGRLRFFRNEKNIGYNKNFEKAVGLCNAGYIAICDQDDIWETNKIEIMMQHWPAGSLFIYSLSGSFSDDNFEGRKLPPDIIYSDISDVHKLVFNSPVHGHASMFKKELLTLCMSFPDDIFYDWWMSMHAASAGTIAVVPLTLTWHRIHQHNSSADLLRITDKKERYGQLREQCIYFIEAFCKKDRLDESTSGSLLYYSSLLKKMDGKTFSWPMFRYAFKNRKRVFHYKKQKPFLLFSYLKHAYRMAYKGLL